MTDLYMTMYHLPERIRKTEEKLARLYALADECAMDDIERGFIRNVTDDEVNAAWDNALD